MRESLRAPLNKQPGTILHDFGSTPCAWSHNRQPTSQGVQRNDAPTFGRSGNAEKVCVAIPERKVGVRTRTDQPNVVLKIRLRDLFLKSLSVHAFTDDDEQNVRYGVA